MPPKKTPKGLMPLLKQSVNTYVNNPVILAPFVTIAFIQLLALEILYFSPRFPLNGFFNPIVATLWGPQFTHYPANMALLPKLFQNAQIVIYLFLSGFFISVAMRMIAQLNSGKKIHFLPSCRETLAYYIHIFVAALVSFGFFVALYRLYNYFVRSILQSSQLDGSFFILKKVILVGSPYVNLLIGALVSAIFAFVFPAIVIDGKKIIAAFGQNFRQLFGSFWYVFAVVLVPTLFFVPVILLRSTIGALAGATVPEARVVALVVSVIFTMFIDATIYTAIASFYLLKREQA